MTPHMKTYRGVDHDKERYHIVRLPSSQGNFMCEQEIYTEASGIIDKPRTASFSEHFTLQAHPRQLDWYRLSQHAQCD